MLNNIKTEDLLETAEATARYITTKRIKDEKGIRWSIADAFFGKHFCNDEISLYSGSAGIGQFLLHLYKITNKKEYLEDAIGAADYMVYRWNNKRELDKNFSLYAYTTGYAGVAVYLSKISDITGKDKYFDCVKDIVENCIKESTISEDGVGRYWSDYPGIVGNAGTILFILYASEKYGNKRWKEFAIESGKYYLNKGHKYENGIYYDGVNPAYFGLGNDMIDPNFPMGTAGIGYLLLKLYEASSDERFLKAEEPILNFEERVAVKKSNCKILPHTIPYRPNLFYLSYCHGPVGTVRYFYEGYRIKKDSIYKDWCEKLVNGLEFMGAPAERSEGFWQVHNICCGTAGLMNLFTGLFADDILNIWTKDKIYNWLGNTAKVLLENATYIETEEGKQVYWIQALDRVTPDRLSKAIGYYEGAAGIADMLLVLYQILTDTYDYERAIDDPFPGKGSFNKSAKYTSGRV